MQKLALLTPPTHPLMPMHSLGCACVCKHNLSNRVRAIVLGLYCLVDPVNAFKAMIMKNFGLYSFLQFHGCTLS